MDYSVAAAEHLNTMLSHFKSEIISQMLKHFKGEKFILAFLSDGGVLIPSELSAEMGVSSARVAVVLRNLEAKGLVTRETDKKDRRKVLVSITEAGRIKASSEITDAKCKIEQVFREMGEDNTREFIRTIELFLEISSKLEKE
ncbi:MAG: MarR family transcriptional regulator [Oscillospiraceae bacterium]|nr:MarR family transcriptional regulator [Oscillospiraceae bacterium]